MKKSNNYEPKIKAYINQIESGQLKTKQHHILKFLMNRENSNIVHMRAILNMPHQSLTGSLSLLCDYGVVSMSHADGDEFSTFKFEPNEAKREQNREHRERIAFLRWMKQGAGRFAKFMDDEFVQTLEFSIESNKNHTQQTLF